MGWGGGHSVGCVLGGGEGGTLCGGRGIACCDFMRGGELVGPRGPLCPTHLCREGLTGQSRHPCHVRLRPGHPAALHKAAHPIPPPPCSLHGHMCAPPPPPVCPVNWPPIPSAHPTRPRLLFMLMLQLCQSLVQPLAQVLPLCCRLLQPRTEALLPLAKLLQQGRCGILANTCISTPV